MNNGWNEETRIQNIRVFDKLPSWSNFHSTKIQGKGYGVKPERLKEGYIGR